MYTLVCIHESFCSCTRWLWPLCQGHYEVKSTCKFIFIFLFFILFYLPGYQSEAIKVVAGGFQPGMISKLANQTLYRMATAYIEAKNEGKSPPMNYSVLSHNTYLLHMQSFYVQVTLNSEQVVFCNCMTNSLWTYALVAIYGI